MKTPMPHQRKALRDIVPAAKKMPRLTTIMPCGTGKTMVQLWAAEALKPKTVLVLLPSLSLLRQTLHVWMEETKWKNPNVLCVCSDQTVAYAPVEDEMVVTAEDLGYPVTSDSAEVGAFLLKKTSGVKLVFSTYHSSPLVAVGMKKGFAFDLGVFDEAHVTAGEEGGFFSFALKDKNLPVKVRTFWTATPRHYDLSKMAETEDVPIMYSMDDEAIYGPKVHQLTFRDAVKQKIICDYEVLVSVVTNKMLGVEDINNGTVMVKGTQVPAKIIAHHVALQQAIMRYGVKKIFTFHPRVSDAEQFTNGSSLSVVHSLPKDFSVYHVNGEMSTVLREEKIRLFRHARRALMSNARCLTQGIDVPAVDLVAFLSKKRSLIDIVQATGRAMRRAPGKTKGYILVPLYIEQGQGETLEEAVQRSDFREVWAVLNAMREQDEALAETMSRIRIERGEDEGRGKGPRDPVIDAVTVIGPQLKMRNLRKSITTICVDKLAPSWDEMYGRLKAFKEVHGHCRVVRTTSLGNWVKNQRSLKIQGRLSKERITLLEKIRFEWVLREGGDYYPTWEEAHAAVVKLGIKECPEYKERRSEDPRLPPRPDQHYGTAWKKRGKWRGFFRTTDRYYSTWEEASAAAQRLKFKSSAEYKKDYSQDPMLHSNPNRYYEKVWKKKGGWSEFLGFTSFYPTWEEASLAAQKLGIKGQEEYRARYSEDPRLPSSPFVIYASVWKKNGGMPGFLGKTSFRRQK